MTKRPSLLGCLILALGIALGIGPLPPPGAFAKPYQGTGGAGATIRLADLGSPATASATGVHAAVTLGAATQTVTSSITAPDGTYGRNVTITGSAAAGTKQAETATVVATVTTAGNASAVVTGAALTGSPVTYSVAVALSDNASAVAGKIRAALAAQAAITNVYTVSGATDKVILTSLGDRANDGTLNIATADGTSVGVTTAASSANTTAGVAGVSGTVTVAGTSSSGAVITEGIVLNGTATAAGAKAFYTVTSLAMPAGGGTVSVGTGNLLGLGRVFPRKMFWRAFHGGSPDSDSNLLSATAVDSTHIESNTYEPAGDPDGAAILFYYVQ